MRATRLTFAAAVLFVAALSIRVTTLGEAPAAPEQRPAPVAPDAPDYIGSVACARCHEESMDQWEHSLHIRMTQPVAQATILGDFRDGTRFSDHGRSYEVGRANGKPFIRVTAGTRPPETFVVEYTLGFKRYQGYIATLADGRMYVLPAFWHVQTRRWLDWQDLAPVPDGAHDLRQIWNVNCFNCHATNLTQGYNVATRKYETKFTETGVGCEACHGPGREHAALLDAWTKNPSLPRPYDKDAADLSAALKIFVPRTASPRQVFDTCAYCHGNKTNVFTGFRAGSRFEDFALPFLLSTPVPDNDRQGEFWPDGRPNRFNRSQAVTQSGCFESGQLSCANCHVSHGSKNPFSLKVNVENGRDGDTLCTQCHSTPRRVARAPLAAGTRSAVFEGPGLEQHTFHKADSAGSRCVNCHMSDVNWRLLVRRRDHTYKPPVPEMTAAFGVPNACTTCHDDRSPEWAAAQMDVWWGDGDRRKATMAVADAMYRAGSGDASSAPALARLAVDRSQPAFVRASAAEYLARFVLDARGGSAVSDNSAPQSQTSFAGAKPPSSSRPRQRLEVTPAIVNALIGAASDPDPTVRAVAVRGLAAAGDGQRALMPVIARLSDSARVVRMRAAEALLVSGVVTLPGIAGPLLERAQDDYLTSMRMFPDAAGSHASIAWMEAQRGRLADARAAADEALRVEPRAARPWVVKGVISAREGKFAKAIEEWKKARSLEPSYPNIDRLIAEAEKLKGR